MDPILVLRHGDDIPLGLLGDAIAEAGLDVHEVLLHRGEEIPPLDGFLAVVVLGGEMGAYDEDAFPWLVEEKAVIRAAHERGLPMLGICLGPQLISDALGGSAYLADRPPEVGVVEAGLTDAGADDPVLRHMTEPVVAFHQDTWDPPPGATLLARSEGYNHAFRLGSTVGIQGHPEATPEIVEEWMTHRGARSMMDRAGVLSDDLRVSIHRSAPVQREMSRRLFRAWVEEALAARVRRDD